MRGKVLAVALAAVTAALAGCGGSSRLSKSAYEQKLKAEGRSITSAFAKISGTPSSLDALAKQVGAAQASLKKAADDLDGINPPQDAQKDNDKFVAALRALEKDMDVLKQAALKGNPKLATKAEQQITSSRAIKDADAATKDLKAKGYKIGAFGQ